MKKMPWTLYDDTSKSLESQQKEELFRGNNLRNKVL